MTKNKCISMLLQGLAFVAFIAGDATSLGQNPKYGPYDGARAHLTGDGPRWGIFLGIAAAVALLIAAHYFEKKD